MQNIYKNRTNVNSLFGTYDVNRTTGLVDATNINDLSIYDYVLRSPDVKNLGQDIYDTKNKLNMKFKPAKYIKKKNDDLAEISIRLRDVFKDKYKLYLEYGYSQKQAQQKAKEAVDMEEKELLKLHKVRFPKEANELNLDKIY